MTKAQSKKKTTKKKPRRGGQGVFRRGEGGVELGPEDADRHAWERVDGESDKAWAAFVEYREMGPSGRTLDKVAIKLGKTPHTVYAMSARWAWRNRVRAYDVWKDRQNQLAQIEAVREMKQRHIGIALNLQGAAHLALRKIIESEKNGDSAILKPNEVKELIDLGVKLERLSRGEPESVVGHELGGGGDGVQELIIGKRRIVF